MMDGSSFNVCTVFCITCYIYYTGNTLVCTKVLFTGINHVNCKTQIAGLRVMKKNSKNKLKPQNAPEQVKRNHTVLPSG